MMNGREKFDFVRLSESFQVGIGTFVIISVAYLLGFPSKWEKYEGARTWQDFSHIWPWFFVLAILFGAWWFYKGSRN